MKRMACALALAAGTGLTLGVATHTALAEPAHAATTGLKLSVAPLGAVNADSPVALDVNFRGGKIRSVEVYLDGNRIAKETINTVDTHGVLSFKLPASLLTEGSHEIMVQAIDKDGSTATTTTRLRVNPAEQESIAHFMTPKRNAMVKEFAPIEIKLDEGIKDAYVVFFLDGAFLSARNYSPYVYSLDTSKYSNGAHTIKVEVWDSTGASILKTLTMPLKVNNYGGLTTNQKTTDDLNHPKKPTTPDADAALMAPPSANFTAQSVGGSLSRSGQNAFNSMGVRNGVQPHGAYVPARSTAAVPGISISSVVNPENGLLVPDTDLARSENLFTSGTPTNASMPSVKLTPTHISGHDNHQTVHSTPKTFVSPIMPGILAEPSDLNALDAESSRVARQTIHVRHTGNVAARPNTSFDGTGTPVAAMPVAAPVKTARIQRGSRTMHNSRLKTFDIAFDNSQIAFDVPPRVENGLPLAPFRAIFEHSGGSVKWFGESKTVRAINNSKEIEIHIGENEATVNNQKVKMDAKAYIDRGRTIVPLSFVRDAMDVKVSYDAKTGHVLIESNK